MVRPIPVWDTLSDSFVFVAQHLNLLCKSLILPVFLVVCLEILFLVCVKNLVSPLYILKALIDLVLYAWIINIACRVVITQHSSSVAWSSAETWTAIWLVCLTLVISMLAGALAMAAFAAVSMINQYLALMTGLITFILMHFYLFARFVLVFPATAMGDKASFREAWELSVGNGWRLVLLFFLVPFLYALIAMVLGLLLPVPIFQSMLGIISIFFCLVGVVAVSMAYKQLRMGLTTS